MFRYRKTLTGIFILFSISRSVEGYMSTFQQSVRLDGHIQQVTISCRSNKPVTWLSGIELSSQVALRCPSLPDRYCQINLTGTSLTIFPGKEIPVCDQTIPFPQELIYSCRNDEDEDPVGLFSVRVEYKSELCKHTMISYNLSKSCDVSFVNVTSASVDQLGTTSSQGQTTTGTNVLPTDQQSLIIVMGIVIAMGIVLVFSCCPVFREFREYWRTRATSCVERCCTRRSANSVNSSGIDSSNCFVVLTNNGRPIVPTSTISDCYQNWAEVADTSSAAVTPLLASPGASCTAEERSGVVSHHPRSLGIFSGLLRWARGIRFGQQAVTATLDPSLIPRAGIGDANSANKTSTNGVAGTTPRTTSQNAD